MPSSLDATSLNDGLDVRESPDPPKEQTIPKEPSSDVSTTSPSPVCSGPTPSSDFPTDSDGVAILPPSAEGADVYEVPLELNSKSPPVDPVDVQLVALSGALAVEPSEDGSPSSTASATTHEGSLHALVEATADAGAADAEAADAGAADEAPLLEEIAPMEDADLVGSPVHETDAETTNGKQANVQIAVVEDTGMTAAAVEVPEVADPTHAEPNIAGDHGAVDDEVAGKAAKTDPLRKGMLGVRRQKGTECRYFVLYSDVFEYYKQECDFEKGQDPLCRLNFSDLGSLEVLDDGFEFVMSGGKRLAVAVSDPDDLERWIEALRRCNVFDQGEQASETVALPVASAPPPGMVFDPWQRTDGPPTQPLPAQLPLQQEFLVHALSNGEQRTLHVRLYRDSFEWGLSPASTMDSIAVSDIQDIEVRDKCFAVNARGRPRVELHCANSEEVRGWEHAFRQCLAEDEEGSAPGSERKETASGFGSEAPSAAKRRGKVPDTPRGTPKSPLPGNRSLAGEPSSLLCTRASADATPPASTTNAGLPSEAMGPPPASQRQQAAPTRAAAGAQERRPAPPPLPTVFSNYPMSEEVSQTLNEPHIQSWLASFRHPLIHVGFIGLQHEGKMVQRFCILLKDRLDAWSHVRDALRGSAPQVRWPTSSMRGFEVYPGGFVLLVKGRKVGAHVSNSVDLQGWSGALLSVVAGGCSGAQLSSEGGPTTSCASTSPPHAGGSQSVSSLSSSFPPRQQNQRVLVQQAVLQAAVQGTHQKQSPRPMSWVPRCAMRPPTSVTRDRVGNGYEEGGDKDDSKHDNHRNRAPKCGYIFCAERGKGRQFSTLGKGLGPRCFGHIDAVTDKVTDNGGPSRGFKATRQGGITPKVNEWRS